MYQLIKEFIKPEFAVLIPVLYIVGVGLKKSEVKDKFIPWILGGSGILLCVIYLMSVCTIKSWQDVLFAVFTGIVQGVMAAGASVYANQLVKQTGKEE